MADPSRKKKQAPSARLPKGFQDRSGDHLKALRGLCHQLRSAVDAYGFHAIETPSIEYSDAIGAFLPDVEQPGGGVFSFKDDDEKWLSLRYDLTAPLARHCAAMGQHLVLPFRCTREGYVFRREKPGPGRFREFYQVDADIVGAPEGEADAEILRLAFDAYEAAGLAPQSIVARISSRQLVDALLEQIFQHKPDETQRLRVLRAIDKFERLGEEAVALLLGAGRMDKSGDFTHGASLDDKQIARVLDFLKVGGLDHRLEESHVGRAGLALVRSVLERCRGLGRGESQIVVDPAIVRGLGYYTSFVFEVSARGLEPFGALGGGGRYDHLIGRFDRPDLGATGFSIGVSRLLAAMEAGHTTSSDTRRRQGPIVITVLDPERFGDYAALAQRLRRAGQAVDLYVGSGGLKAQMRYADRISAPFAIIQGEREVGKGSVIVKDLRDDADQASDNETIKSRGQARQQEVSLDALDAYLRRLNEEGDRA